MVIFVVVVVSVEVIYIVAVVFVAVVVVVVVFAVAANTPVVVFSCGGGFKKSIGLIIVIVAIVLSITFNSYYCYYLCICSRNFCQCHRICDLLVSIIVGVGGVYGGG